MVKPMSDGYDQMAVLYDAIYEWKDYAREAALLRWIIAATKRSAGNTLLDVACGTGKHLAELRAGFAAEGLDLSEPLLAVARQRLPNMPFHLADMTAFDLGQQFDVVTCLFSAIGHVRTLDKLNDAVRCMSAHTKPGGVLLIEPWFAPDEFHAGTLHKLFIDKPDLKIARINLSEVRGTLSVMDLHHLVGTAGGVQHFVERLEMGLFTRADYLSAFTHNGLQATFDEYGLMGRGLYIGVKA